MSSEVGHAYVTILPSAEGFGEALQAQIGPEADKAGAEAGRRTSEAYKAALDVGASDTAGKLEAHVAAGAAEAGAKAGAETAAGYREALAAGTAGAGPDNLNFGTVGLDDAPFEATLAKDRAEADALARERIEPTLDADDAPFDAKTRVAQSVTDTLNRARATTTLDADTTPFDAATASAREKGLAFGAQKYDALLELDDEDAKAKLAEAQDRIDALFAKIDQPKFLKISDTNAKAQIDELRLKLEELNADAYDVKINSSGVDKLRGDLGDVSAELDKVAASAGGAGGGIDKLSRSASGAAGSLGGSGAGSAGGAAGGMLGAALALAPALVTVGAYGAAGLIGVAGAAATAAVSLGAVGLVAKPLYTSLSTAATAQLAYNNAVTNYGPASRQATTAMNTLANATAQLSPAEQVAAVQLGNFKNALQDYQQSFDPQILPLFTNGFGLAKTAMSDFSPVIKVGATALSGLEVQARSALGGPFWQQFFTLLAGQGGTAITTFGHLIGGAATGLAGLDRAFAPLITELEASISSLGSKMTAFGQEQTHTGIQSFIAYVDKEGPLVEQTLRDVASGFGTLVKDAAPVGPIYLQIIDAAAKLLDDLIQFDPALTSVAIGLAGAGLAANKLLGPLGGLKGAFTDVKAVMAGFAGTGVASSASGAEKALAGVGSAAKGVVGPIRDAEGAAATFGAVMDSALLPLGLIAGAVIALGVAYHVASGSSRDAKTASDSLVQGFDQQAQAAGKTGPALEQFYQQQIDRLHAQETALNKAGDSAGIFEQIVTGPWQKNTAYKTVADEAKGLQSQLDALKGTQAGAQQAQQQLNDANQAGAPLAADLTTKQNDLTKAQQNLGTATTNAVTALDNMLNVFLNADNANLAFKDNLASLISTVQGQTKATSAQTSASGSLTTAQGGLARSQLSAQQAAQGLTTAQNNLAKAQASGTPAQIASATTALTAAQNRNATASLGLTQSQQGLTAAQQKVAAAGGQTAAVWNNVTNTFDENSAAGVKAEHAMNTLAGSAGKIIDQMLKAHAPVSDINARIDDLRGQMETAGKQIGVTTDQTDSYLKKVGFTPQALDATIKPQTDANNALIGAQGAYNNAATAVHNYTATLQTLAQFTAQASTVGVQPGNSIGINLNPGTSPRPGPYSPLLPHSAAGTPSAIPGWNVVGEDGWELINAGGGETILPHDKSVALGVAYHSMNSSPGYSGGIGLQPSPGAPVFHIDARGAQVGVAEQVKAAIIEAHSELTAAHQAGVGSGPGTV